MGAVADCMRDTASAAFVLVGSVRDGAIRSAAVASDIGTPDSGRTPWQVTHRAASSASTSHGRPVVSGTVEPIPPLPVAVTPPPEGPVLPRVVSGAGLPAGALTWPMPPQLIVTGTKVRRTGRTGRTALCICKLLRRRRVVLTWV